MRAVCLCSRFFAVGLMWILIVTHVRAGAIVPMLNDATAVADYTTARNGSLDDVADITGGELTLAARFNPAVSQATGGPVVVIEVGGTSNGTGLYLADGHLVFAAKADNGRYSIPDGMNDTDFSNDGTGRVMAVDLGPITFGAENTVYVSMDLHDGHLVAGINGTESLYTITNSTGSENLDGNHTVSFLGVDPIADYGHLGGLLEAGESTYPLLFWTAAVPLIQTAGYTNQRGQVFAAAVPDQQVPYTIVVSESDNMTAVAEGGAADAISISMTEDPLGYPVTLTLSDASEPDQVQIVPSQIVFDTNNWQTARSVTLTAVDDSAQEPRHHTATVQFDVQVDPASGYAGYVLDDLIVDVIENDCGFWGYGQIDTNQDCQVNLEDFLNLALGWLECTLPEAGCIDYRP